MYKVFVGDKPIILTTKIEPETHFKNFLLETVSMRKVFKVLSDSKISEVRLINNDKDLLLKLFLKKLPNVIAGGGKVKNTSGDILFIYRNDKWDLPKGKAERRETIDKTALREVEEETGVTGLKIVKPLERTFHVFKRNGRRKIKVTYWFEMETEYNGELLPQLNEGITKVAWLDEAQSQKALENSYANIKLLI